LNCEPQPGFPEYETAAAWGEAMRSFRLFTYENALLLILGSTFGVVFMDRLAVNYLAPFIVRDLHLNSVQVGAISAALSVTWAIANIGFGRLSDLLGKRKLMLVATIIVFSVCSFVSGLATSFAVLIAARLFMGVAEGPVPPLVMTLMAQASSPRRLALNTGIIINGFLSLFAAVLGPIVLLGLAQAFNWRVAFWISAVPGLILAALIMKFVREAPAAAQSAAPRPQAKVEHQSFFRILARRNIILCTVIACFTLAGLMINSAFSSLYMINVRHIPTTEASLLLSVQGVANMASFAVAALSDRIGRKPTVIAFSLLSMIGPLAMVYFHGSLWAFGALLFVGGLAQGVTPILFLAIPAETVPMRQLGTVSGFIPGVGELIGSVGGPIIAGRAADLVGLQAPFLIIAGCALAAGILGMGLKECLGVKPHDPLEMAAAVQGTVV
jgi:MFS family permease